MATGKQHKTAILVRSAAKGPRKKRTRPQPRQYTVADVERARDRVAAAECRATLRYFTHSVSATAIERSSFCTSDCINTVQQVIDNFFRYR